MKQTVGSSMVLGLVACVALAGGLPVLSVASAAVRPSGTVAESHRPTTQGRFPLSRASQSRLPSSIGLPSCAGSGFTVCIDPGHPS
ncbi:MAG: hypothetical protein M3Y56_15265, partial [Armatimonadota bacterium]|nr:hypothetical protein [Armatimonadota bacterium]